jgi:hypothetical protein
MDPVRRCHTDRQGGSGVTGEGRQSVRPRIAARRAAWCPPARMPSPPVPPAAPCESLLRFPRSRVRASATINASACLEWDAPILRSNQARLIVGAVISAPIMTRSQVELANRPLLIPDMLDICDERPVGWVRFVDSPPCYCNGLASGRPGFVSRDLRADRAGVGGCSGSRGFVRAVLVIRGDAITQGDRLETEHTAHHNWMSNTANASHLR